MPGRGEDRALGRNFDDLAEVHHRHPVGHVLDDREIVADEQQREAQFLLDVLEQVDDLRLHRNVERGDGLVAHDEVGLGGERAGDADALALPAGELMRPAVDSVARQPHLVHQLGNARVQVARGTRQAEIADRLGEDVAHAHARVQTRERILEHDLHAPAQRTQGGGGEVVDAAAVEHHLTGRDVEQPQDRAPDRRLAAAALADERERLAARDREGDAVDRVDEGARTQQAAADPEVFLEIVDLEQRRAHAATASRTA